MKKSVLVLLMFALLLSACGIPAAKPLTAAASPAVSAAPTASPEPAGAAAETPAVSAEADKPGESEAAEPAAAETPSAVGSPVPEAVLSACDGYAVPEKDGVKYWLDTRDGLKLHCWFISSDPDYYEKVYTVNLKKASYADGVLTATQLLDRFGFPLQALRELTLRFEKDGVTMKVDVDEKKLAGGTGDNLLGGSYRFVPWGKAYAPPRKSVAAEPFGELILPFNGYAHRENGVVRCWLETADGIRLHCWFRSEEAEYRPKTYTVTPARAERHGDWITCGELLDEQGQPLPGLRALSFQFREGSVLMSVTRDPGSLDGGTGDSLLSGLMLFTPYSGSYLPPILSGRLPVVSEYDGYTCTRDGNVLFWLESSGLRINLTLHCFFPTEEGSVQEQIWHIDSDRAYFVGTELIAEDLLDRREDSVFDGYSALSFRFSDRKVLMHVERDPNAETAEPFIPEGDYLFLPPAYAAG